jgi:hypothetical protein
MCYWNIIGTLPEKLRKSGKTAEHYWNSAQTAAQCAGRGGTSGRETSVNATISRGPGAERMIIEAKGRAEDYPVSGWDARASPRQDITAA